MTGRTIGRFWHPRTGITAFLLLLSATTELGVLNLIPQHDPQPDPQLARHRHTGDVNEELCCDTRTSAPRANTTSKTFRPRLFVRRNEWMRCFNEVLRLRTEALAHAKTIVHPNTQRREIFLCNSLHGTYPRQPKHPHFTRTPYFHPLENTRPAKRISLYEPGCQRFDSSQARHFRWNSQRIKGAHSFATAELWSGHGGVRNRAAITATPMRIITAITRLSQEAGIGGSGPGCFLGGTGGSSTPTPVIFRGGMPPREADA